MSSRNPDFFHRNISREVRIFGPDEISGIVESLSFLADRFEVAIDSTYATRTDRSCLREARKALDLLDPERKWRWC